MRHRRGAIIIVVLVIVMMVSLAAYHFTLSMESEHLATRNLGDQIANRHCALSGVELLAAILEGPRDRRESLDEFRGDPIDLWPTDSEDESPYRVRITTAGTDAMPWVDESGKLNLNQLLQWDRTTPGLALEALLRFPQMDQATAERLLDWIDSDSQPRPQGDESKSRNSVPLLIEELAFLQPLQSESAGSTNQRDDSEQATWIDQLTVHSAERNESFDGRPRIFLNNADLFDLHRQLSATLSTAVADFIVAYRQYGPSAGEDPNQTGAPSDEPVSIDFSISASVEIKDLTQLINSFVTIPKRADEDDEGPPVTITSPIVMSTGAGGTGASAGGQQPIDEIFDQLTLSKAKRLPGRINIMTASAEVLAAIPGVDESLAEQLVRRRENIESNIKHPIGLLSSLSLDLTIVRKVIPHLTVAGDVVRAQFVGAANDDALAESRFRRPTYCCEVILDASQGRSRQLAFRQLNQGKSLVVSDNQTKMAPAANTRL